MTALKLVFVIKGIWEIRNIRDAFFEDTGCWLFSYRGGSSENLGCREGEEEGELEFHFGGFEGWFVEEYVRW